jgi:hypothetical protein
MMKAAILLESIAFIVCFMPAPSIPGLVMLNGMKSFRGPNRPTITTPARGGSLTHDMRDDVEAEPVPDGKVNNRTKLDSTHLRGVSRSRKRSETSNR